MGRTERPFLALFIVGILLTLQWSVSLRSLAWVTGGGDEATAVAVVIVPLLAWIAALVGNRKVSLLTLVLAALFGVAHAKGCALRGQSGSDPRTLVEIALPLGIWLVTWALLRNREPAPKRAVVRGAR